jgi:hypothetical protein
MEIHVAHQLGGEEVRARIEAAAREHDVSIEPAGDGVSGVLEKAAPFVGKVRARYEIRAAELTLEVIDRPKLLPEATLRRMLEQELARFLS